MKTTIWTLPLAVALAACSGAPANNAATGNDSAPANSLSVPGPRPANSVAAAPGQPALPPGLDCVRNKLSPEERRSVAQFAMDQGSRDDPRARPLLQAVDTCAAELHWSQSKRRLAGMFSMSAAGVAAVQEELRGQGISLTELDQAIESDRGLMAAASAGRMDGSAGMEFSVRHAALIERMMGDRAQDRQLGVRIGNYIAFRALAIAAANSFAQEP